MSYGIGPFGDTPYGGSVDVLFDLTDAEAVNPYIVVLTFSESPDFDSAEVRDPSNYFIHRITGGSEVLPVLEVTPDPNPLLLRLVTGVQSYAMYEVVVNEAIRSVFGSALNPSSHIREFTGYPLTDPLWGGGQRDFADKFGKLRAQAIQDDQILVSFNQQMLVNSDFLSPSSYAITGSNGTSIPVSLVEPSLPVNTVRTTLRLVTPLARGVTYWLTVSRSVRTSVGLNILPPTTLVVRKNETRTIQIPISRFSGEVRAPRDRGPQANESLSLQESLAVEQVSYNPDPPQHVALSVTDTVSIRESLQVLPSVENEAPSDLVRGLFGSPNGLVFFSPSLTEGGSANSVLQVDKVRTCTEAYDTYRFPASETSTPLYTHGGGLFGTPQLTTLNTAGSFLNSYRSGGVKLALDFSEQETLPVVGDITANLVLQEPAPVTRIAKLNSPGWLLFKNPMPPLIGFLPEVPGDDHTKDAWLQFISSAATPSPFITVDNLTPLPGPTYQPTNHFVNPVERLSLVESMSPVREVLVSLDDSLARIEDFDLVPGETVVQVNLAETLTVAEEVATGLGVHFLETINLFEGLSLSS